jgi:N-acetylmuramic acid 6-phosphate etherase
MPNSTKNLVPTEQINPKTRDIDLLSTGSLLAKINAEDALVANAVRLAIPHIAVVVDKIVEAFRQDGHLFYFGAGTSGRLGVLDASECPPTYGASPDQVQAFIAGGDTALRTAVEGAEDSEEMGVQDFNRAQAQPGDVVVALSASGGAAYVLGVVRAAKAAGCFTAAVTCHPASLLAKEVHRAIVVEVGPEAIAGSTRMKAGTAQKMVLNMLTTGAMIQIGKTYENLMVDVQPTNKKLKERACRIVAALAEVSQEEAHQVLETTGYQVKPAILMLRLNIGLEQAQQQLNNAQGKLRLALSPALQRR